MSVLSSFLVEVRIASPLFPPSPRSRLVKNVMDTKLVKYLAKYQRFSIGSLRKTADWLYCFAEYLKYAVILHTFKLYVYFFVVGNELSEAVVISVTYTRYKYKMQHYLNNLYISS